MTHYNLLLNTAIPSKSPMMGTLIACEQCGKGIPPWCYPSLLLLSMNTVIFCHVNTMFNEINRFTTKKNQTKKTN